MPPLDIAQSSCSRCRKRRVKCDRRKPGCQRCEKYSQPCPGYEKERLFRDEGPSLHRKFASTRSSKPHSDATGTSTSVSPGPVVLSDPTGLSASNVGSGIINSSTSTTTPQEPIFDDSRFFDLDPAVYYDQESDICDASAQLHQPVPATADETDHESRQNAHPYDQFTTPIETQCNSSSDFYEQNHKQDTLHALLIRRFVEFISPWLDILDKDKYFGYMVPIRARRSRLLRDSVAAAAAKQLGNLGQNLVSPNGISSTRFTSDAGLSVDWAFEAASFYDKAIRSMITSLQSIATPTPSETPPTAGLLKEEDIGDLLAAMPILLVYELLDNHHLSIVQHLAGAQHLLGIVLGQQEEAGAPNEPIDHTFFDANLEDAWKAAFWNFATFDYFTSYTNCSKTRFGFANTQVWRASGLSLTQVDGCLVPASLARRPGLASKMTDTVACRTLLWVVLKILDCIAAGDQSPDGQQSSQFSNEHNMSSSAPDETSVDWSKLDGYLTDWYSKLPNSFEPCFRIPPEQEAYLQTADPSGSVTSNNFRTPMQGLFIANPMGAASISLYHFSRILTLLHGPLTDQRIASSTGPGRLQAHRQFSQQVGHHASEIYAAAIGKPLASVQMHLVLPLSLAGLCLDSPGQKTVLKEILLELQNETGILTTWAIEKFQKT
ncbi:hypothetical protein CDV36_013654 [Fusarium kuroshium]|uniref:Zn(2)-C6 fungal-type domain-containing protein n=1 Tax=Fusarium kuroshium TaxID=2010991 RepID=A0A3M2RN28_9HYPO|nr:hypothetical protein CDV36_013654 [Fusarium kuroshium]